MAQAAARRQWMQGIARQASLDPGDGMELWETNMRQRLNVYFPPELAKQVDELAIRRRISRSAIVEAAVAS